jgi:hypothetical protein
MNVSGPVTLSGSFHPPATAPERRAAAEPAREGSAGAQPQQTSLWELLTPEEREFFAQQATLGSLTYRAAGSPSPDVPAPTGQRIDLKG